MSIGICGDIRCNEDRERKMVVIERDAAGTPTVWCDPCLSTIVAALNAAGIEARRLDPLFRDINS